NYSGVFCGNELNCRRTWRGVAKCPKRKERNEDGLLHSTGRSQPHARADEEDEHGHGRAHEDRLHPSERGQIHGGIQSHHDSGAVHEVQGEIRPRAANEDVALIGSSGSKPRAESDLGALHVRTSKTNAITSEPGNPNVTGTGVAVVHPSNGDSGRPSATPSS